MATAAKAHPVSTPERIPPLRNGDRLTREEFERRLNAMPQATKAELIEGRVFGAPPTSFEGHSAPHADLMGCLAVYRAATPGVRVGDAGSIRLDLDNMPQPDAFMIILPSHGGQAKLSIDDYIEGAPEFVVEISATTANYDLHDKLQVYRRNGVKEYIVWRTFDMAIDWFVLRQSQYVPLATTDGVYRSETFRGLWLDATALIRGDLSTALNILQRGLSSPEHATFTKLLRSQKAKRKN